MAGRRGVVNPFPKKGEKPTNIFSRKGYQKKDPIGPEYYPDKTGAAQARNAKRKGPTPGRQKGQ